MNRAGAGRLAWGLAAVCAAGCVGLAVALVDAQDRAASLETRLLVAERAAEAASGGPPPRARRGDGPLRRARRSTAGRGAGGSAATEGGTGGVSSGMEEADEAAALAAERSDAGAGTRAERALASLELAIAELDLEPGIADEVRAIYEETFEDGARIRDEVRAGERDEDSAREAHKAVRDSAREELEALLEPDELTHIRRTVRRGGRGRL